MFEFKPFSVEIYEQGQATSLLDYHSLDQAKKSARSFMDARCERMINVIAWDQSLRRVVVEWALIKDGLLSPFASTTTTH